MSLKNLITELVREELSGMVRRELSGLKGSSAIDADTDSVGRPIDDPDFGVPAKQSGRTFAAIRAAVQNNRETNAEPTGETRKRRRRGRGAAKVAYVLMPHKGRWPRLNGNPAIVLDAMRKADGPMTNIEIETETGMRNKPVQSAVWLLKSMGLIKAKPLSK